MTRKLRAGRTRGGVVSLIGAVVLASAAASAADMDPYGYGGGAVSTGGPAYEAVPAIASPWNWTGPYLGGTFGYAWGEASRGGDITGAIGGVTAGINGQHGAIVFGAETDFNFSGLDGRSGRKHFSSDYIGTVRGRIGYAFDRFVAYGTGGLAYGSGELSGNRGSSSRTHFGWTAGFGIEAMITGGLSAKVEYLYVGLDQQQYRLGGNPVPVDVSANLIRFGLNYRF
jgi:outer membrane immunogenic protein